MLLNKNKNTEEFLNLFHKKFSNFLEKAPLVLTYNIQDDKVAVLEKTDNIKKTSLVSHLLDYDNSVSSAIAKIKCKLIEYYPLISEVVEEKYSSDELNALMEEQNLSLREALQLRKITKKNLYRVIRVNNTYNEINIIELSTNKILLYKFKQPVILFLDALLHKDEKKAYELFAEAILIKCLGTYGK